MDTVWVLVAAGSGHLHAGRVRHAGGRLLAHEERRERGGEDPGQPRHRGDLFWAVGFAFAFGRGMPSFGTEGFFLLAAHRTQVNNVFAGLSWTQVPLSAKYLFQVAFCAVSLAIVWGTMLERTKFAVYVIFAVVFAGLIYPMVGHWIWGGGWLGTWGCRTSPAPRSSTSRARWRRWREPCSSVPVSASTMTKVTHITIPGHNMPLAVLGVLILWVGWFGFNPGSTMAAIPEIADIALTTNLAAAAGVLGAMIMSYVRRGNVDVGMGGNGAIAALVAITAGCAFVAPWASIVIGFLAGVIMYLTLEFVDSIGVDDPLGAIAAHGMGGIWGTLSLGLFTTPDLAAMSVGRASSTAAGSPSSACRRSALSPPAGSCSSPRWRCSPF